MMKYKRIAAALLCFVMIISIGFLQVSAKDTVEKDIKFTVEFRDGAQSIVGAEFLIYKLGEFGENGELELSDEYADYPVDINIGDDSEKRNTALTLEGYILRDELSPYDECITDVNGIASFPNERDSLNAGVYLIVSADFVQNDTAYISLPFIAVLPAYAEDGVTLNYDVTAVPKYEALSVDGEGVSRSAVKVWNDDGNEDSRPEKVTVDLLCNGKVFDTVVLSAENNWRCQWDGLDESCHWTVVERETAGYTVEIAREENVFVIKNTYEEEESTDTEPIVETEEESGSNDDGGEKLPQTGQLWWPVPVLLALGLLFLVVGIARRRGV